MAASLRTVKLAPTSPGSLTISTVKSSSSKLIPAPPASNRPNDVSPRQISHLTAKSRDSSPNTFWAHENSRAAATVAGADFNRSPGRLTAPINCLGFSGIGGGRGRGRRAVLLCHLHSLLVHLLQLLVDALLVQCRRWTHGALSRQTRSIDQCGRRERGWRKRGWVRPRGCRSRRVRLGCWIVWL